MVSAGEKGKETPEEDHKDYELDHEVEEEAKKEPNPHSRATIASIGVVAEPSKFKVGARIKTGRAPHHPLASRKAPPGKHNPFHTLIHGRDFGGVATSKLPSLWDIDRSNNAGEEDPNPDEGWGDNSKSWDSQYDRMMNRIEQNMEMIRNLYFQIEDLTKLIHKLVKNSSPPSGE
jgi:hypothetical protein